MITDQVLAKKLAVLDVKDKRLRQQMTKQTELSKARAYIGSCTDMCPERERYLRLVFQQSIFERDECNQPDEYRMVKEYRRAGADQEEPLPHDLRTPKALEMTMDYLICNIMDDSRSKSYDLALEWYDYLWDRLRAIRKDITQQNICDQASAILVERCTRFHVHSCYAMNRVKDFDADMNKRNLNDCLQMLRQIYNDLRTTGIICMGEFEFQKYDILLHLDDGSLSTTVLMKTSDHRSSNDMKFIIQVFNAYTNDDYYRFFKFMEQADYMTSCILSLYVNKMRLIGLRIIISACTCSRQIVWYPCDIAINTLGFDGLDDIRAFASSLDIEIQEKDLKHYLLLNRDLINSIRQTSSSLSHLKSIRLVESKMQGQKVGQLVYGEHKLPQNPYKRVPLMCSYLDEIEPTVKDENCQTTFRFTDSIIDNQIDMDTHLEQDQEEEKDEGAEEDEIYDEDVDYDNEEEECEDGWDYGREGQEYEEITHSEADEEKEEEMDVESNPKKKLRPFTLRSCIGEINEVRKGDLNIELGIQILPETNEDEELMSEEEKIEFIENTTISWFKDDEKLNEKDPEVCKLFQFTYDQNEGFHRLIVRKATKETEGVYTCLVENESGTSSCSTQLVVGPGNKPKLTSRLQDLTVYVGQSLEFRIKSTGKPPIDSCQWFKDNKLNIELASSSSSFTKSSIDERISLLRDEEKHCDKIEDKIIIFKLCIDNMKYDDAGRYKCRIINEYGYDETDCFVKVLQEIIEEHEEIEETIEESKDSSEESRESIEESGKAIEETVGLGRGENSSIREDEEEETDRKREHAAEIMPAGRFKRFCSNRVWMEQNISSTLSQPPPNKIIKKSSITKDAIEYIRKSISEENKANEDMSRCLKFLDRERIREIYRKVI